MVVGQDVVTKWLSEGWELYGSPVIDAQGWVRQALTKEENPPLREEKETK